jgi:uncharacterized repeat protein (TIGR01451 family)
VRARQGWWSLFVVASLAGCGGGGDSGGGAPGGGNPPPPPAGTADVRVTAGTLVPLAVRGGLADYRITVTNDGPDAAANVALTTSLDGGQAPGPVACAATGGAVCPATLGASMTVPTLPRGGTLNFSVSATIPADTGTFSATMSAALQGDPVANNNVATASVGATARNRAQLASDAGDYIGAGQSYGYTQASAVFSAIAVGNQFTIQVAGDQGWNGVFQLPQSFSQLVPGQYANVTRWPFHDPAIGGLSWYGEGRGCNSLQGSFTISRATYHGGALIEIDLAFEQHCEGQAPALRGQVHWSSVDTSTPPGPLSPPPASLWAPPAGATPTSGSYVYLQSDFGDYVGGGNTFTFTQANAILTPSLAGGRFSLGVGAGDNWSMEFQPMTGVTLQPGYYGNLRRWPFHNPTRGGLSITGEGRGCNQLTGWFVIDSVTIVNNALEAIELRFEQHCEGLVPALRGKIRWIAGDTTAPPGPVNPPPTGLWQPAPGTTPPSGTFIYLQSDAGDYIGGGSTYLYTAADTPSFSSGTGGHLTVNVGGWRGDFQAMLGLARLEPGYYGNVTRWPFHNPTLGGLDWSGQGRGCNRLTGWFVVDSVSYVNNVLASISLRFEQHCEGMAPAMRGQVHWVGP